MHGTIQNVNEEGESRKSLELFDPFKHETLSQIDLKGGRY